MKFKAIIVGPTGEAITNTTAFQLLYSYPTRESAEDHADCLRSVGTKIVECDEPEKPKYGREPQKD